MTTEEIQEIINRNFNELKGSNEAILHASEEIADIFLWEKEHKDSLVDGFILQIKSKDKEIADLKEENKKLNEIIVKNAFY
jgi:uncharacterized protein YllA (UPF0747 family)